MELKENEIWNKTVPVVIFSPYFLNKRERNRFCPEELTKECFRFLADEDTAEDYYTEEKTASTGKKKRGRKPKVVEPEPEPEAEGQEEEDGQDEEYAEEKPKRRRTTKKSKKALDAMDG